MGEAASHNIAYVCTAVAIAAFCYVFSFTTGINISGHEMAAWAALYCALKNGGNNGQAD